MDWRRSGEQSPSNPKPTRERVAACRAELSSFQPILKYLRLAPHRFRQVGNFTVADGQMVLFEYVNRFAVQRGEPNRIRLSIRREGVALMPPIPEIAGFVLP